MSKLVTVKEYAKLFNISLGTIYKYIKVDKHTDLSKSHDG